MVLIALEESIQSSLTYWLQSQGHHGVTNDETACQKLAIDFAHLSPYLNTNTPIPSHWPEQQHWLLIDAHLSHNQLISAIHAGCKHISLAPIDQDHLQQWLAGKPQIIDLQCQWPDQQHARSNTEQKLEPEPMLLPFINCLMGNDWSDIQKTDAAEIIGWRNLALQAEPYTQLNTANKLSSIEFAQLACHTLSGQQWLTIHGLEQAAIIASQHHEHWDGSGYPNGVTGTEIFQEARLAKLYDSYMGLRRNKTYAKACDHHSAMRKLSYGDGYVSPHHFDPQLLARLQAKERQIETLYASL